MSSRKKNFELIFNLQWRNRPGTNGGSNIIGMYDTPATTNFDSFKSYLLKNSGVGGDDIQVAFVTDKNHEWLIENQVEFEKVLCAFRLKARLGEVINLNVLEWGNIRFRPQRTKASNDVETQFNEKDEVPEDPPEWFVKYMDQFKNEVIDELKAKIASSLQKDSVPQAAAPIHISTGATRKVKQESSKRSRKHHGEHGHQHDIIKTQKYDRKYDNLLEKLNAKTKKIKDKKMALWNNMVDGKDEDVVTFPDSKHLGLHAVNVTPGPLFVRVPGGAYYMHNWVVLNRGNVAWPEKCQLRFSWGTEGFKPTFSSLDCPPLKPNEKATLTIGMVMPTKPGTYESHWDFFYDENRFGESLRFIAIIEPEVVLTAPKQETAENKNQHVVVKEEESKQKLEASPINLDTKIDNRSLELDVGGITGSMAGLNVTLDDIETEDEATTMKYVMINSQLDKSTNKYGIDEEDLIIDVVTTENLSEIPPNFPGHVVEIDKKQYLSVKDIMDRVAIQMNAKRSIDHEVTTPDSSHDVTTPGSSHDNNNNSPIEISDDSEASDDSFENLNPSPQDNSFEVEAVSGEDESDYVYVTIDGKQNLLPKHILREDYLRNLAPSEQPQQLELQQHQSEIYIPTTTAPVAEDNPSSPHNCLTSPLPPTEFVFELPYLPKNYTMEKHNFNTTSMMSHCSAAGSCFSDVNSHMNNSHMNDKPRFFVFPQGKPGYEVIRPEGADGDQLSGSMITSTGATPYDQVAHEQMPLVQSSTPDVKKSVEAAPIVMENNPWSAEEARTRPVSQTSSTPTQHNNPFPAVPNFQQDSRIRNPLLRELLNKPPSTDDHYPTPPSAPPTETSVHSSNGSQESERFITITTPTGATYRSPTEVHLLPENLVNGAVNVASSAINTARSVIQMIRPQRQDPGRWVGGHWVTEDEESPRAKNLRLLGEMGFWDIDRNATLLARYNDDVSKVVTELLSDNVREY